MVEYTPPAWKVSCLDGEVLMVKEDHSFAPSVRSHIETCVEYGGGLSLDLLFALRDRVLTILEQCSYESKEKLLPLVRLTRENSEPPAAVQWWAETLSLLPGFDVAFFFRVVSSQISNGEFFVNEFRRQPSEANVTALLTWAASVDGALRKYAAICLASPSFERKKPARGRQWIVSLRLGTVDMFECAG